MAIFQHKFSKFSLALKILSLISLITLIINGWNVYKFYPWYALFIKKVTFFEYLLSLPWQYPLFFLAVCISGFLNYLRILYLFPIVAYFLLVSSICHLINNFATSIDSSTPSLLDAFFTTILLLIGMLILFFWHKKNRNTCPTEKIKSSLKIIAFIAYIVLIIMSTLIYQNFTYYLEQNSGFTALALDAAGLRHLILLGFICIFGLKKWPSILWLFPFMAYSFTWTYMKGFIYYPEKYTLPLQVATILLTILTVLGLYTLYLWIRQLIDVTKSQ